MIGYLPITAGALPIRSARRTVIGSAQCVIGYLPIKYPA